MIITNEELENYLDFLNEHAYLSALMGLLRKS